MVNVIVLPGWASLPDRGLCSTTVPWGTFASSSTAAVGLNPALSRVWTAGVGFNGSHARGNATPPIRPKHSGED